MPNATYRYDVHKAFQIFFDPTYGLMHYLSKNLVSSFNPSVLHVNVVYDLPVCLAAMQAGRGESQPENAKGNGHFSRNPSSPYDAIPTLVGNNRQAEGGQVGDGCWAGSGQWATLYQETATLVRTGQKLYISKILSNRCP